MKFNSVHPTVGISNLCVLLFLPERYSGESKEGTGCPR
jgi:hypothetical protein